MSDPKWTKGEWVASGRHIGTKKHMSFIAECRGQHGYWDDDAMSVANARLMAASKDMYEALPDLSAVITWLENGCDPANAAKELRIYAGLVDAAKAKAKGA